MSRVMRFFCWLMALAVLLSGMCFEKIKADSILRCPEFSAAREVLEYTTESEPAASAEMEFLPQVTCNTHSEGNVQEEAPAPPAEPCPLRQYTSGDALTYRSLVWAHTEKSL